MKNVACPWSALTGRCYYNCNVYELQGLKASSLGSVINLQRLKETLYFSVLVDSPKTFFRITLIKVTVLVSWFSDITRSKVSPTLTQIQNTIVNINDTRNVWNQLQGDTHSFTFLDKRLSIQSELVAVEAIFNFAVGKTKGHLMDKTVFQDTDSCQVFSPQICSCQQNRHFTSAQTVRKHVTLYEKQLHNLRHGSSTFLKLRATYLILRIIVKGCQFDRNF